MLKLLIKMKEGGQKAPQPPNQYLASKSAISSLLEHAQTSHKSEGGTEGPPTPPNQYLASKSAISSLLEHAQTCFKNEGGAQMAPQPPQPMLGIQISYQQSVRTFSNLLQK